MTSCMEAFLVTHYLAKFNDHMLCHSKDITYLICHVTLQDHEIKESSDFIEGSSSLYVTILPSLVAVVILIVDI